MFHKTMYSQFQILGATVFTISLHSDGSFIQHPPPPPFLFLRSCETRGSVKGFLTFGIKIIKI